MSKILLLCALLFIALTAATIHCQDYILDPEAMREMGYFNLQQQVMINKMLLMNHEEYMKELHAKELLNPKFKKYAGNYHLREKYTSMVQYLISYIAVGEQILKEKAARGQFDAMVQEEDQDFMELNDTELENLLEWI